MGTNKIKRLKMASAFKKMMKGKVQPTDVEAVEKIHEESSSEDKDSVMDVNDLPPQIKTATEDDLSAFKDADPNSK